MRVAMLGPQRGIPTVSRHQRVNATDSKAGTAREGMGLLSLSKSQAQFETPILKRKFTNKRSDYLRVIQAKLNF